MTTQRTQQQQISAAAECIRYEAFFRAALLAEIARQQPPQPAQQRMARPTRPTAAKVARACHELAPITRRLPLDEQCAITASLISAQRQAQGA